MGHPDPEQLKSTDCGMEKMSENLWRKYNVSIFARWTVTTGRSELDLILEGRSWRTSREFVQYGSRQFAAGLSRPILKNLGFLKKKQET